MGDILDVCERWTLWRVRDPRGMGFHSSWSIGEPYSHLDRAQIEVIEVMPATPQGAVDPAEVERLREALRRIAAFYEGGWPDDPADQDAIRKLAQEARDASK